MDQAHVTMIDRLRVSEPQPCAEHCPVLRVITVPGRRSGTPRPFPANVTTVDGRWYACSATRDRDWVRNLMHAGRCRIEQGARDGSDLECAAVLVDRDEAATVLSIYLPQAGVPDPRLPFAVDAPVERMREQAHLTAVVRFDPVPEPGSPSSR